tara:strand:+ start:204 stop:902 length:699 start_codon:yes stop_codon:yes gene_type:complete
MGAIGGLDVAYGASAQIIQTNVLIVDNTGETAGDVNPDDMANFLTLYNHHVVNLASGRSVLEADFICAAVGPTGSTGQVSHRNVLEANISAITEIPVAGAGAGDGTGLTGVTPVSIIACGACEFTGGNALNAATAGDLLGGTGGYVSQLNGDLLANNIGTVGKEHMLPVGDLLTDTLGLLTNATNLNQASLATGTFVEKGNATGATPTAMSDLTVGANSIGLATITALCYNI